ncbi:sporulation protein YtfJ [Clostridium acetobutylicum]|uniref:Uncharacterized protein, YTFJ Bacillus subtilis ortholog n=1 Tax=Clostridium acetobutylicum (strain ATCC 824 / DSM 792 / JCM 1419 / IAM 19013 / LMG 5710 / NBRC 13948 / NRRL B-527 / VKM B-1787 / 2291 / W) TaxID=272562 RepID=Q97HF2_CLOAB|nr:MULTISPECIES: GerW family sporulation protein [Clostridium]AAK80018.1 Uncharacterized protein, YTFJ Bacillus subtilis ortholog [Clostridium acetobutylicum ATCC 824]ADZ21110.1 Conserved hypothetical protein [Clostridium acetobutylicum EA 2018]AEI32165.1 hypothetical protein SMB_G2092 [Clostridium acetobutylicum DSM 1731]AWV79553.1 sporulation protein YtfJ [Clostridium acetobutylicum]KHD38208.1 sporulation protein [Clostridium acetobutylicum]
MDNNPIENFMRTTMENIKGMIDVNTIVGEPIKNTDGSLIIPISKVSFGFASGGSEFKSQEDSQENKKIYPFGGGAGAGVSLKPIAFLVIKDDSVRLLPLNAENTYEKVVDMIPQLIEMCKGFSHKSKKEKCCNDDKKKDSNSTNGNTDNANQNSQQQS